MEKSKTPTSQYQVFCDTYDMKCEVKIHLTDEGEQKLHLSLNKVTDASDKLSLSLYAEDVKMLVSFLEAALPKLDNRN